MSKKIDRKGPQKARDAAQKLAYKTFPGSVLKMYSAEEMRDWTKYIFMVGYRCRKQQESSATRAKETL